MKVFTSMRKMFASLAVLAAVSIAGATAKADPILFDPDGTAPANGTLNVGSFGFETANTLAQAAISGGNIIAPGSTFQLYIQTRLTNLTISPGGATVTPAGLNGTAGGPAFEITLTGSITEQVVSSSGGTATFRTADTQSAGSFLRMFEHSGLLSDNFTGAGFAVGTVIMQATPSAALGSSGNFSVAVDQNGNPVGTAKFDTFDSPTSAPGLAYANVLSVTGSGSSLIHGLVTSTDPNFFKTPVTQVAFNSFNNVPFTDTTPSQFFNNITNTPVVPANHGTVNGITGPDFQFQNRTSASFTPAAVPEPASAGLMALGLVSVLGYSWRKSRRSA